MKRTAWLLLPAAGVATLVLYLSFRRQPEAPPPAPIPELLTLVPPDSSYIVYADLAALRSSPFLAQLTALSTAPEEDPEYTEFVRATGFDYSRDLDHVMLAIQTSSPRNSTLSLAQGRFNRQKLSAYALRSGRLQQQQGFDVYLVPGRTPLKTVAFTFLSENRIALADVPNLALVLGSRSRSPSALDPAMQERIARVAGAAFFVVGRVRPLPKDFSLAGWNSEQLNGLLRNLRWVTLAARPDGEQVRVVVEGECDTPEAARQLEGTLDGLRLLSRLALADAKVRRKLPPPTAALLDHIVREAEVSRAEHRVRLTFALTQQLLQTAPADAPRHSSPR